MRRTRFAVLGLFILVLAVWGGPAAAAQPAPQSARDEYFLGSNHMSGLGVEKDYAKAEVWFRRAAERGYARAQTALGKLHDEGLAGRQDHAEAEKWYRRAATQGEPEAQYLFGYMHELGRVVPEDRLEAWKWYSLAAEQGFDRGRQYRDRIAREMTQPQLRDAEIRLRAWRPKREPQG